MNCRKFETLINELAREQLMDAATKGWALGHARECERCAARLADERALTSGLRALASLESKKEAPAGLEASLLAAFRQQRREESPAPAPLHTTRFVQRWQYWAVGAAAAAMLFAVALGVARLSLRSQNQSIAGGTQKQAQGPTEIRTQDERGPQPALIVDNDQAKDAQRPAPAVEREQVAHRKPKNYSRNSRRAQAPGSGANRAVDVPAAPANEEIATDFLPLTYDAGTVAMDSGQVVRVELPRSALVSMGLPMNMERGNEPIKADVLLGDDGVARAIRFVR